MRCERVQGVHGVHADWSSLAHPACGDNPPKVEGDAAVDAAAEFPRAKAEVKRLYRESAKTLTAHAQAAAAAQAAADGQRARKGALQQSPPTSSQLSESFEQLVHEA